MAQVNLVETAHNLASKFVQGYVYKAVKSVRSALNQMAQVKLVEKAHILGTCFKSSDSVHCTYVSEPTGQLILGCTR